MDGHPLEFRCNGQPVPLPDDLTRRLVDVLRGDLGLLVVKEGCGEGECGACAVLVDGCLVNACLLPVGLAAGREVLTIEGLRDTPRGRWLTDAFVESGAVQCGFCTPGMLLAAEALLRRNPRPDREAIRQALAGNLCRCTGMVTIFEAVELAVRRGGGVW